MSTLPSWRTKPKAIPKTISMQQDLWDYAKLLGGGNTSRGIQYSLHQTKFAAEASATHPQPTHPQPTHPTDYNLVKTRAKAAVLARETLRTPGDPEPLDPSLETGAASQARAAAVDAALRARAERLRAAKRQADQDQDQDQGQGHE